MKKTFFLSMSFALVLPACGDKDAAETGVMTTTATGSGEAGGETGGETGGDSTTTATTTTTTTDSGGSNFVTSDSAMSCGTMCDPWNPGDCPDGEKCTSVACEVGSTAWDSNVCVPVMGTKALGDECMYLGGGIDGLDDCGPGLMCWDQNPETGLGNCVAFCTGSPTAASCADPNNLCSIYNNGVLPLCLPKCDPLAPACPNPDNLCIPHPSDEGFNCVLNASGDMAPYGTPCEYANSCNAGLLCIDATAVPAPDCSTATGCCSEVCDTTAPNSCQGAGQECVAWYEAGMAPPNYETVGVCAIPA